LAGASDLDYDCDRCISKQCDSNSRSILCYFYYIIPYTSCILYTVLYSFKNTIIWQDKYYIFEN
jgi:hypothetical protein